MFLRGACALGAAPAGWSLEAVRAEVEAEVAALCTPQTAYRPWEAPLSEAAAAAESARPRL